MNGKKKIVWLLLVLLVGVWGAITIRIYDAIKHTDNDSVLPNRREQTPKPTKHSDYVYNENLRDPFSFSAGRAKAGSSKRKGAPKPVPVAWMPPPLKLGGILMTAQKKTVMLERGDGSVFFLSEGDTLAGVRILSIKDTLVTYTFATKRSEWSVARQ